MLLILLMLLIVIKNNLFKNKGKVIPVTWYSTFIRFWSLVRWLIAWLMLNTTRVVFQIYWGREQVQWYIKTTQINEFWLPLKCMEKWVETNRNIPSSTNREKQKRKWKELYKNGIQVSFLERPCTFLCGVKSVDFVYVSMI